MHSIEYGYEKHLGSANFENVITRVTEALQEEGFGVLTQIDVKDTLKKKLDRDFRRYRILGACNPVLASQALDAEPHIGLLLPCNIVVQEFEGGDIVVSIAAPKSMFQVVSNPALQPVADEADRRLKQVMNKLGGT